VLPTLAHTGNYTEKLVVLNYPGAPLKVEPIIQPPNITNVNNTRNVTAPGIGLRRSNALYMKPLDYYGRLQASAARVRASKALDVNGYPPLMRADPYRRAAIHVKFAPHGHDYPDAGHAEVIKAYRAKNGIIYVSANITQYLRSSFLFLSVPSSAYTWLQSGFTNSHIISLLFFSASPFSGY
jgi:hypothetical protein